MTSGEGQKYRVAYLAGVLFCVGFLFPCVALRAEGSSRFRGWEYRTCEFALGRNMGRKTDVCV